MFLKQILDFTPFYAKVKDSELPLPTAYKLNKINAFCNDEEIFYKEKLVEIINKYAEHEDNGNVKTNEDGSSIIIQKDKIADCNKELSELEKIEVFCSDNIKLTLKELESLNVTPADFDAISPFIKVSVD